MFYSLLYKDFVQPNITSDVNGQFMGADMKVHTLASGQKNQYGMYSGWDIYHSLAQLQAMLDPAAASDQAQSQLNYYTEDKLLQQWGYLQAQQLRDGRRPEQSIIADYYAFGAHGFNTKRRSPTCSSRPRRSTTCGPAQALEQKYGYLPEDGTYGCCNAHGFMSPPARVRQRGPRAVAVRELARRPQRRAPMLDAAGQQLGEHLQPEQRPAERALRERAVRARHHPDHAAEQRAGLRRGRRLRVPVERTERLRGAVQPARRRQQGRARASSLPVPAERQRHVRRRSTNEFDLGEQFALDYAGDPAGDTGSGAQHREHRLPARAERY